MQAYAQTASKVVAEAENALRMALQQKEPNYAGFESLLEKFRKTSQDYVFLTFATATAKTTEDRLWDGHVKVNRKYQKHLKQFREGAGKKKHVERRKAEKHYLHFIKSSMHFYRGYIQRLASHFRNIPDLALVAAKLRLDTLSTEPPVNITIEQQTILIASCHNALMRLGDLSRYRETELEQKERDWGPAKGHYQLALTLKPESGAAYNQLAVMALADDDHLRAVYYLHRSAAAGKPFPVARDNIKLEFDKQLKLQLEEKSAISDTSKQTIDVLENRLMAFHARCNRQPSEFLTFTDKATQLLQLVALGFEEIKDRSLDKLVQKMCLINIAAEHLAWRGASPELSQPSKALSTENEKNDEKTMKDENWRNCHAVLLLQRFNILTFTALLKILAREMASESDSDVIEGKPEEAVVPVAIRRLLPHLRQYSSWLLSNIRVLLSSKHASLQRCLDVFWKTYLQTVNILLSKYEIGHIQDVQHLLAEDEDTLEFAPFTEQVSGWRFNLDDGKRKPAFEPSAENPRPTEAEMLARIQRFVYDAATITNQKDALGIDWAPIAFLNGLFVTQEKPVKAPEVVKPKTPSQPFRIRAHAHTGSANGVSPADSPKFEQHSRSCSTQRHLPAEIPPTSTMLTPVVPIVEGTVNAHTGNDTIQPVVAVQTPTVQPPSTQLRSPTFNTSSVLVGTGQSSPGPLNIMDIVRDMQRRSAEPLTPPVLPTQDSNHLSNPSLPGLWSTVFTPRPGETTGSSPRPGTSSGMSSSAQTQRSSAIFQQELLQREREIQLRTSPQPPVEMSSWPMSHGHTPAMQAHQPWDTISRPPWHSPSARSPSQQQRQLPQTTLFGAIGEPRRNDARTPASGYSG